MLVPINQRMVWENPAALRHSSGVNEDISITMSYHNQLYITRKIWANINIHEQIYVGYRNTTCPLYTCLFNFCHVLSSFRQACRLRMSRLLSSWIMALVWGWFAHRNPLSLNRPLGSVDVLSCSSPDVDLCFPWFWVIHSHMELEQQFMACVALHGKEW